MSRPRRLPALRVARIGGWTAVATAGVAVVMTRFSGPGGVPAVPPAAEPGPTTTSTVTTTTQAALPSLPAGGLLVLYLSPTPGVPAEVTTTTAAPAAPASQPVTTTTVPAPPPVTSSGS